MEKPVASVCGVTDLMAEEGHRVHLPGEGCDTLKVRLRDEEVKRRKDEIIEWEAVKVQGRIPRMEVPSGELGGDK